MKYRVTISKCRAGRVQPSDVIEDWENPRYGFYWWFWKPRLTSNGGLFKRCQCVDVGLQWLCFSIGLIFWPK